MTPREKWLKLGRRVRWTVYLAVVMALVWGPYEAKAAQPSVKALVAHAHGDPFKCNPSGKWSVREDQCVVHVVYRRRPGRISYAMKIIRCESGWDEQQVTPPYRASGLAQFLPGTWASLARYYRESKVTRRGKAFARHVYKEGRKIARHSILHPVWSVRGLYLLGEEIDQNYHQWDCA